MKARLYTKKLDGNGHIFSNTIDVPKGTQEWRVPVRQPIGIATEPIGVTADFDSAIRVFRRRPNFFEQTESPEISLFEE